MLDFSAHWIRFSLISLKFHRNNVSPCNNGKPTIRGMEIHQSPQTDALVPSSCLMLNLVITGFREKHCQLTCTAPTETV